MTQLEPMTPAQATRADGQGGIAVVGMACLFPGAPDLKSYWHNITRKVDAITDPPPEAWDPQLFYDPDSTDNDRVYCKRGGYISPLTYFDPLAYGIMPRTAEGGEPDQWLALQVARAALTDAGFGEEIPDRQRTAVIIGKGTYLNRGNLSGAQHGLVVDQTLDILRRLHPEYGEAELQQLRRELKQQLPPFNADTAAGLIPNIIAGRIANRLDLMGPSYTVDGACASSLLAVDMAVRDLLTGRCDMALVGGAHVVTPVPVLMLFCQLNALSHREQIRPFDRQADGTILGEGVGMVVLKRVEDALRDGHRIYAIIRGVGTSSDGRELSVMAPRLEGEVLAMQRAYAQAEIAPETIGLIEAHGTGTPVGDETEVNALTEVLGTRRGAFPRVALGSVKSMISHTMPAAGVAGLIKTALALYHKTLPPTLNVDDPIPALRAPDAPLYLNTETRPWVHGSEQPRRAAVNAFGFGGINAHVILEEAPPAEVPFHSQLPPWESEAIILAAPDRPTLIAKARALRGLLDARPDLALADLAYTYNVVEEGGPVRLGLVASDTADLAQKLDQVCTRLADPGCTRLKDVRGIYFFGQAHAGAATAPAKLAFLFPGEGSQYVNMLADLCLHFPEVRAEFDRMDRVFEGHARGYRPSDLLFPPPAFTDAERAAADERIRQMEGAVETVLTANQALFTLLTRLGIRPDALLGHSTGEYSALLAAGMIDLGTEEQLRDFTLEMNHIYHAAPPEAQVERTLLVAVAADVQTVTALLASLSDPAAAHIAMDNCPHQTVVACRVGRLEELQNGLQARGLIYEILSFDRPYHTQLFEPYAQQIRPFLQRWIGGHPATPLYSCTAAAPFPHDLYAIHSLAYDHWLARVEFRRTVERMYADGIRTFVEVGAKGNLTAFVGDILRGKPHTAVAANLTSRSGITQLNHLVAMLAAQGMTLDLAYLYQHRAPQPLDLAALAAGAAPAPARPRLKLATGFPAMTVTPQLAEKVRPPQAAPAPAAPLPAEPDPAPVPAASAAAHAPRETMPPASPRPASRPVEPQPAATGMHHKPVSSAPLPPAAPPAAPPPMVDAVMAAHFRTMDTFLAAQEEVMQAFLRGGSALPAAAAVENSAGAAPPAHDYSSPVYSPPAPAAANGTNGHAHDAALPPPPVPPPVPPPAAPVDEPSVGATPLPEPTPPAAPQESVQDLLLRLVSERTGYPAQMLDLDLDLEANLGIDSIKRVEILGALQRETGLFDTSDMEALSALKTLRSLISFLEARRTPAGLDPTSGAGSAQAAPPAPQPSEHAAQPARRLPFIHAVMEQVDDQRAMARCTLNLAEHLFLRDHTLGRAVSTTDPGLAGLPVMPLTFSLELLAEGATLLEPARPLVTMRDIRAYRWIVLGEAQIDLEIVAQRTAPDAIHVALRLPATPTAPEPALMVEGTLHFATGYPTPPAPGTLTLRHSRPSAWTPATMYTTGMFHGPLFRNVLTIDGVGEDGARATIAARPPAGLLHSDPDPGFITDPVLLDMPGQVVGFWTAEQLQTGYVIFPFYLAALHFYRPRTTTAVKLTCHARIELAGELQVSSDLDVIGPEGDLWMRFERWEDRRFDLPTPFYQFLLAPQSATLSQVVDLPALGASGEVAPVVYRLRQQDFPESFFTGSGGIWLHVTAHALLGARERKLWYNLTSPLPRRIEWLLGRAAAKDAIRHYLSRHHGLHLAPADVEILPDEAGRPLVSGIWTAQLGVNLLLSIAHTAGVAVAALAAVPPSVSLPSGIGIDLEQMRRTDDTFAAVAFTPGEQAWLAGIPTAAVPEWSLRLWCAKEALAKALGTGLTHGPQSVEAVAVDLASGRITLSPPPAYALAAPQVVQTWRQDDDVLALCLAQTGERLSGSTAGAG